MNRKQVITLLRQVFNKFGKIETEQGILLWDSEEDLKSGDPVFIEDEEQELQPAPDGEYKTEDGKTIIVVNGEVAEIVDPEAEVAPEQEPEEMAEEETPEVEPVEEPNDDIEAIKNTLAQLINDFQVLQDEFNAVKDAVNKLLEAPQAEEAFSVQTASDTNSRGTKIAKFLNK